MPLCWAIFLVAWLKIVVAKFLSNLLPLLFELYLSLNCMKRNMHPWLLLHLRIRFLDTLQFYPAVVLLALENNLQLPPLCHLCYLHLPLLLSPMPMLNGCLLRRCSYEGRKDYVTFVMKSSHSIINALIDSICCFTWRRTSTQMQALKGIMWGLYL